MAPVARVVAAAVLSLACVNAHGDTPTHTTWTVTDTNGDELWSTSASYNPLTVAVGDELRFIYGDTHDVQKMANASTYAACSGAGAIELADNEYGSRRRLLDGASAAPPRRLGGSHDHDHDNIYDYTVTDDDFDAGTIYFSCSYYPAGSWSHCFSGQALEVTVVAEISSGPRAAAPSATLGLVLLATIVGGVSARYL